MKTPTTVDELLDYWPGNIPFKGSLVNEDGSCMCAQGQALHFLDKMNAQDLRDISRFDADRRVAKLFSISVAHSVLLRIINDSKEGAPSVVIRNPEQVLGNQASKILAFWWHLDKMTATNWAAVGATARNIAWDAAWVAAVHAASAAAWTAAADAARTAAWTAAWATIEIQSAEIMRQKNQPFFFLPMFGFSSPEDIPT